MDLALSEKVAVGFGARKEIGRWLTSTRSTASDRQSRRRTERYEGHPRVNAIAP
jgi:hypothetical protein